MKQVKVLMLTLVVLMGVGFTSCMDSDNNTTISGAAYVKVHSALGTTYFTDANGFELYPSASSLAKIETGSGNFNSSSTMMAYVVYQYDTSTQQVTENTTKLNVELLAAFGLDATFESVSVPGVSDNDSIAKAPIISLKATPDGTNSFKPVMYDDRTLLLPINYFMSNFNHYFTLIRYENNAPAESNQVTEGEGKNITLYLRHNNAGDTSTSGTSLRYLLEYTSYYGLNPFYKAFNLSSLHLKPGDKLTIKTMESSNSIKLEDATEVSYEVDIKSEED